MSEKPHCKEIPSAATCCTCVKFCHEKEAISVQFLTAFPAQMTESKHCGPGSYAIAGFTRETATKMQVITAVCTVGLGLCIQ
jgi:hypothetical protein